MCLIELFLSQSNDVFRFMETSENEILLWLRVDIWALDVNSVILHAVPLFNKTERFRT